MSTVHTVAAQFAPNADAQSNLAFISRTVSENPDAQLVVFPEYSAWFHPDPRTWRNGAQPVGGEFVASLGALVSGSDRVIVAGFIELADDKLFNAVVAVSSAGVLAHYRKLHLYDAYGHRESDWLSAGDPADGPSVFTVGGLVCGIQTCYDIRFPEVSRRLIDAGAEVLIVPSDWVPGDGKSLAWNTLTTARAIENVAYLVAANHAAPSGTGESRIVSPLGVGAELAAGEAVVSAVLDRDEVVAARERNPALALRRFDTAPR
ncbi:MAG: hypothetical protein RL431_677 [Actinomycetota bacterium]|jgi:predicted amidohydrolase